MHNAQCIGFHATVYGGELSGRVCVLLVSVGGAQQLPLDERQRVLSLGQHRAAACDGPASPARRGRDEREEGAVRVPEAIQGAGQGVLHVQAAARHLRRRGRSG